ncbi:MAG: hypothetical protein M5U08_26235, partial [Burkholderiales bacterium]|nr:hypothetical protein [Burkholderiales bacterium]
MGEQLVRALREHPRSAWKRARPRLEILLLSRRTRLIMFSTTPRFLPRSARSSESCSSTPASRASRIARVLPTRS